jgi:hypothetical protein
MGACYSVTVKINLIDEKGAIDALNKHIKEDKGVNYSLDKYAEIGATTDTFDGLMKILLAEIQSKVSIVKKRKYTYYDNCFGASYGWEYIMIDWFQVLAPFLADNSEMLIYPDEDYDKLVIKNGECIQIH